MSSKIISETKNLFDGLTSKKEPVNSDEVKDINTDGDVNINKNVNSDTSVIKTDGDSRNDSSDLFGSLLENESVKEKYVRGTHYFRQDQLNDITKFAKKAKKGKNEFMREVLDLVFTQLKKNQ